MIVAPEPTRLPADPWPRFLPGPRPSGRYRVRPEDFRVTEVLPFAPEGEGGHRLLRIRKTGCNTEDVAADLARLAGCQRRDVGFAGLKDRRAVAEQHFTVPVDRLVSDPALWHGRSWAVIGVDQVRRKLRRGALAGNTFELLLRVPGPARWRVATRMEWLANRGIPNYFGPQRFGRGGGNVVGARRLLAGESVPKRMRGLYYSAARSYAFNQVLAQRVVDGTWDQLLPGEVALLAGKRSGFSVVDPAAEVDRLRCGDIHPSGPLPGEGGLTPTGAAADKEAAALAHFVDWPPALAAAGVAGDRRPLRVFPARFWWRLEGAAGIRVGFRLPAGSFATAVVRELISA